MLAKAYRPRLFLLIEAPPLRDRFLTSSPHQNICSKRLFFTPTCNVITHLYFPKNTSDPYEVMDTSYESLALLMHDLQQKPKK